MARSLPEWIGATPDTPAPLRVRLRVFERYGGFCHWSGQKIKAGDAWDLDHVRALVNGGENRESNLAPILRGRPHKQKTAADVAEKSKVARIRAKHLGLKSKKPSGWNSKFKRKLDGTVIDRRTGEVLS